MTKASTGTDLDAAPGSAEAPSAGTYLLGLVAAGLLTVLSFAVAEGGLVWTPGIPAALITLAIAQMGVHLVFFLHVTTGPDHTNTVLTLAFGLLVVALVLAGSLWIMAHLNEMIPMDMPVDGGF